MFNNIKNLFSCVVGVLIIFGWGFSGTIICIYWAIKQEFTDAILSLVIPFYGIISVIMNLF